VNTANISGSSNESFAYQNSNSIASFDLYEYMFAASPLQLFFRSTSRPLGGVTRPGFVVIGSGGHRGVKKATGEVDGLVELSLRNQWIVALKTESLAGLANGLSEVNAEVVVYLDPYSVIPFEVQIGQLESSINLGNFPSQLSSLIESSKSHDESPTQFDGSGSDSYSGGTVTSAPDAFDNLFGGNSIAVSTQSEPPSGKKSKEPRRKKNRDVGVTEEFEQSAKPNPGDWDLFN
jgi:hypothetical protein